MKSVNSNYPIFIQIRNLINGLVNKKVSRNYKNEIISLVNKVGLEAEKFMLITLIEKLDFKESSQIMGANKEKSNNSIKAQFLCQQLQNLSANPRFIDYFSHVIELVSPTLKMAPLELINEMIRTLKLNQITQIFMILSLALSPVSPIAADGKSLLKVKLPEYFTGTSKPVPIPDHALNLIINLIRTTTELEESLGLINQLNEFNSPELKPYQFNSTRLKMSPQEIADNPKLDTSALRHISPVLRLHDFIDDLMQSVTSSQQCLQQVLADFPNQTEDDIFLCVLKMANNSQINDDMILRASNTGYGALKTNEWEKLNVKDVGEKKALKWNFDLFIKGVSDSYPNIKWVNVLKCLDREYLQFKDAKSFQTFMQFFQKCKKVQMFNFPSSIIFERWLNPKSQIVFIQNLILNPGELFFWPELQKKNVNLESNPNTKTFQHNSLPVTLQHLWSCQDFIELMLDLSQTSEYMTIRNLFEHPISNWPDTLILGIAQIKPKGGGPLLDEICSQLFPKYLLSHSNSMSTLEALWKSNENLMISAICQLYQKENSSLNLSRVLDITQEIKDSLIPIANCNDLAFSVSLGILAGKREFLHFENWISDRIRTIGNPFVSALIKYFDINIVQVAKTETNPESLLDRNHLTIESLGIIFENLLVHNYEKISPKNKKALNDLYNEIIRLYPVLAGTPETGKIEIENAANNFFHRVYNNEMRVEDLVETLARYKNSQNPQEKEIFACIIHNLFDEFRFHGQYPRQYLLITGQLYGAIIQNKIIDNSPILDLALKCVKRSLENKSNNKRLDFGVEALKQCKGRLIEWPLYTQSLFYLESLRENNPDFLYEIHQIAESKNVSLQIGEDILSLIRSSQQPGRPRNLQPNPSIPQSFLSGNSLPQARSPALDSNVSIGNQNPIGPSQMKQNLSGNSVLNPVLMNPLNAGINPVNPVINSGMNAGLNTGMSGGINAGMNSGMNAGMNPGMNSGINSGINAGINPGILGQVIQQQQVSVQKSLLHNPTTIRANQVLSHQPTQKPPVTTTPQPQGTGMSQQLQPPQLQQSLSSNYPQPLQQPILGQNNGGFGAVGPNPFNPVYPGMHTHPHHHHHAVSLTSAPSNPPVNNTVVVPPNHKASRTPDLASMGGANSTSVAINQTVMESYYKDDSLEGNEIPEEVRNKITFILNNLSTNNIDEKTNDIKNMLENENTQAWFAKILVVKRAAQEQQQLQNNYILLLAKLGKKSLYNLVVKETFICMNKVIYDEKAGDNEKKYLKNIGRWLGQLTLARNKPIVMKHLNIKNMLIDSFQNGKLANVLPFVCKILEGSKDSVVFKPKNPWLASLLSLLSEIANLNDLKISLKCEIQLLFKELGIILESITPSSLLSPNTLRHLPLAGQQPPTILNPTQGINPQIQTHSRNPAPPQIGVYQLGSNPLKIMQLPEYITIDSSALGPYIKEGLDLKLLVAQAVEQAIRDIIPPVISRSVTIALITTRELALRDFASEPDETRVVRGTNLIVQNLAGSLALVTCRDPLKMSLVNHLRQLLEAQGMIDEKGKETIINVASLDNLDLGCALIKKAVIEKALEDVAQDQAILEALEKRRIYREMKKETYFDDSYFRTTSFLPEALKPNFKGLTAEQIKIYEDFSSVQKKVTGPASRQGGQPMIDGMPKTLPDKDLKQEMEHYKHKVNERFLALNEQDSLDKLSQADRIHELQNVLKNMEEFFSNVKFVEGLDSELAQKIYLILFTKINTTEKIQLYIDELMILRSKLHLSRQAILSKELKQFISVLDKSSLDDSKKFNSFIMMNILKKQLLNLKDFDEVFAELLERYPSTVVQMCFVRTLRTCFFEEKFLNPSSFQNSLEKLTMNGSEPETLNFLEEVKKFSIINPGSLNNQNSRSRQTQPDYELQNYIIAVKTIFSEGTNFHDMVQQEFEKWLALTSEQQITSFIKNLENSQLLKGDENLQKFYVFVTDICINNALSTQQDIQLNYFSCLDYSYTDAFSKLITIILKTIVNFNKQELLERILDSVIIVLTKNHEYHREKFNQRPFFKLFFNLIFDIQRQEYNFSEEEIKDFFSVFIKLFLKLQPLKYPGFAFAWLELISNRHFMPTVLKNQENWVDFHYLLLSLLKFFKETVNDDTISKEFLKTYYKGTLRVFLIILHDFSEFLAKFYFSFCEEIPDRFIQVRNLILAAYPRDMRLPDPFHVSHLDNIEDFNQLPSIHYPLFEKRVVECSLHNDINSYLNGKSENDFKIICGKLLINTYDGQVINVPMVNAFVIAVPWLIYAKYFSPDKQSETLNQKFLELRNDSYNLFAKLLRLSNVEMRDVILNAILNQIRFPNVLTYYFINFIFLFFSKESESEIIQEQITRIFVERLINERPHPWGLMYTFIELIRNPKYNFKNKSYFKNTNIFEEILKTVFKSIVNNNHPPRAEEGGMGDQNN